MSPKAGNAAPGEEGEARAAARILIPARNEAAAIGRVVRGCRHRGFPVCVLDDGSADATARVARAAGAEVVRLAGPGHGKTAALRRGLALLPPGVEWVFLLDGDGQHDPADLERFWEMRHGFDLLVGDRMGDAANMPPARRWTNRLMSALLRRSGLRDSQCGFRLLRRSWLAGWLPSGQHFQFETELALLAARRRARVANVPIAATYGDEVSKIEVWRDALNFARCLWR